MSARETKEHKEALPAKELYKCSGCGQGFKVLPTHRDCTSCGAGADSIKKLETDRDAL